MGNACKVFVVYIKKLVKSAVSGPQTTWVWIPAMSYPSYVTLAELLNLSVPSSLICKMVITTTPLSLGYCED